MNANSSMEQTEATSGTSDAVAKRMRQVVGQFLFIFVILFITSGRLNWVWLWAYVGVGICLLAFNSRVVPREVAAERGQPGEGVKSWDRTLAGLGALATLGVLILCGLDERFGWSPPLGTAVHLFGLVLLVLGQLLFTWSMVSNPFFSTLVRIQVDRSHTVASSGPYRYVRHPGYVGYIAFTLATPLIFGSVWALVPAAITGILMVIRTALEDRTLRDELEGYREYSQRVRYRLLPGIW
jgi:protein-S-isoprenylcysteine O-methyltransferase Ste14